MLSLCRNCLHRFHSEI